MKTSRALVAGIADAGLSSLATFVTGIVASRYMDVASLGAYALVFSAGVVGAILPCQLVFVPAETLAVSHPVEVRPLFLRQTLRLGSSIALLGALPVALAAVAVPAGISRTLVLVLTGTGIVNTIVSPVQDHVRRLLHASGRSFGAAVVSAVHLVVVTAGIVGLLRLGAPVAWLPFASLAAGNTLSLAVGLWLARGDAGAAAPALPRDVVWRSGGWLLVVGLFAPATAFLVGAIAANVAGPEALGYAEACRQVGQPLFIFATGLSAVLGPRLTEAAQRADRAQAARHGRAFYGLMLAVAVPYILLTGHAWRANPLAMILPKAYAVPGLVFVTLLANLINGLNFSERAELLGAGRAATLARVEVVGNVLRTGIAAAAGALRSFAIPSGLLVLGLVRWLAFTLALRRWYGQPAAMPAASQVAVPE